MAVAMSGCAVPLLSFRLGSLIITWLLVSLGAQVLKISVDTTLQRSAPDELRGRVFIAYDVVFNLAFVFGVAIVAGLSLDVLDGVLLPTLIAAGYLAVAFVVRLSSAPQWEA